MRQSLYSLLATLRLHLAEASSHPRSLFRLPLDQSPTDQFFINQESLVTCSLNTTIMAASFDPLVATAVDLKQLLDDGKITSGNIVERYLQQIETHNSHGMNLRGVIATAPAPNILALADELDAERAAGKLRGPFHGLPITVKVSSIIINNRFEHDQTCLHAANLLNTLPGHYKHRPAAWHGNYTGLVCIEIS